MNVIFLDFDGVINNNEETVTKEAMITLKEMILKYQALVVITTSWFVFSPNRKEKITAFLNKLGITNIDWLKLGLKGTYQGIPLSYRTLGIIDYLSEHPSINYIVLDDEYDSEYRLLNINHLKTNPNIGLTKEDIKKVSFQKPHPTIVTKVIDKEKGKSR